MRLTAIQQALADARSGEPEGIHVLATRAAAERELELIEAVVDAGEKVRPPHSVGGIGDDARWDRWQSFQYALLCLRTFEDNTEAAVVGRDAK